MIVLKATQDKVLAALQSVAGIVERRHTLPILANVLIRKTGGILTFSSVDSGASKNELIDTQISRISWDQNSGETKGRNGFRVNISRPKGFFSSAKTNLRNAP
jgi:DNA polymerase III sliding clamp (beta) subunit (PCNA family)